MEFASQAMYPKNIEQFDFYCHVQLDSEPIAYIEDLPPFFRTHELHDILLDFPKT